MALELIIVTLLKPSDIFGAVVAATVEPNTKLDSRLQVEVKHQNMVKHLLGIYHKISTLYADPMMNSVELCISYGKFPRDA